MESAKRLGCVELAPFIPRSSHPTQAFRDGPPERLVPEARWAASVEADGFRQSVLEYRGLSKEASFEAVNRFVAPDVTLGLY